MSSSDDANYEVEAILGERTDPSNGKTLYEIKWKGYPHEENTWESREDLLMDGHTDAVLGYEKQRSKGETASGKKKREASRSKTPVKRTQAAKNKTPGKKLQYGEDEAETSSASTTDKQVVRKSALDAKEIFADEGQQGSRLVKLVIAGFTLSVCIALALDANALNDPYSIFGVRALPFVSGLLLLQRFGAGHPSINAVSKVAVWMVFSELLKSKLVPPGGALFAVSEGIWRYEAGKAAGASITNISVLVVSLICWCLVSWEGYTHFDPNQVVSLVGFWSTVAAVDRLTERFSMLNFVNALGAGAGLVACYTDENEWRLAAFSLLTLSAILRN